MLGLGPRIDERLIPALVTDVPLGFGPCFVLDSERRGPIRCSRPTSTAKFLRPLHCQILVLYLSVLYWICCILTKPRSDRHGTCICGRERTLGTWVV